MQLHFDEFLSGVFGRLNIKTADDIQQGQVVNSSIFPTIESQQSWKFAKCHNRLHLHDGNVIHAFTAGDNKFKSSEDFPMTKVEDTSYFDFDKHMEHTGTAQVHRANPGMIYVTLHDGDYNPTYTITHVSENSWRASLKCKKKEGAIALELEQFSNGLSEKLGFDIAKALDSAGNHAMDGIRAVGENPLLSAGIGLGLGGAYDLGRRAFYNTDLENEEETGLDRGMRWLAPAALAGGIGAFERSVIPGHYDHTPLDNAGSVTPNYMQGKNDLHLNAMRKMGEEQKSNAQTGTEDPYKMVSNVTVGDPHQAHGGLAPAAGQHLYAKATTNDWRLSSRPHLGPFTPQAPQQPAPAPQVIAAGLNHNNYTPLVGALSLRGH